MDNSISLFDESVASAKSRKTPKWRLVTNQRNLFYMLAAGLIMSPKGFGSKYYIDTLSAFPGWIPLFADNVPQAAIDLSKSEKSHLLSCIITIDLISLHGKIMAVDAYSQSREIFFPNELTDSDTALLVPAPLPVMWIESIVFASKEERINCESDAHDFGNVPLSDFNRTADARLFSKSSKAAWPPVLELPNRDYSLDKPFAVGGIMAMLLHMGNLGDFSMQAYQLACAPDVMYTPKITDPMIRDLGIWMESGNLRDSTEILPRLFWGAVERVLNCRKVNEGVGSIDVILQYLETAGNDLDEKMKQALSKLSTDLRNLIGFADSTITELFERHPKPFSRVMTIFFLRDTCTDLLEFRHPLLNDVDYVAASILFAARDGWIGLPLVLRDVNGLQEGVSHRMAALAHRMVQSEIDLGAPPAWPQPLRALFIPGDKGWTAKQRDAALILARESKWTECIQTRLLLGKGDYRIVIDGSGVQILLPGEVKNVQAEVNQPHFFKLLSRTTTPLKPDRKVRDLLKI
jgi:hypothetical protein